MIMIPHDLSVLSATLTIGFGRSCIAGKIVEGEGPQVDPVFKNQTAAPGIRGTWSGPSRSYCDIRDQDYPARRAALPFSPPRTGAGATQGLAASNTPCRCRAARCSTKNGAVVCRQKIPPRGLRPGTANARASRRGRRPVEGPSVRYESPSVRCKRALTIQVRRSPMSA